MRIKTENQINVWLFYINFNNIIIQGHRILKAQKTFVYKVNILNKISLLNCFIRDTKINFN